MPVVNHEILAWARESAGFSPEAAVKKLGLKPTRKLSALERLAALEAGELHPSRALLVKMSQQFRRPLVAFYMAKVPSRGERLEDFRAVLDRDSSSDGIVDAIVRDVKARQSAVRDILLDDDEALPLPFVSSMKITDSVEAVATSIQKALRLTLSEFRAQSNADQAFALLRSRAEAIGVFVLLIGNLGSHHTAVDAEAFRGFALADPIAPFVVINDQDAHSAWSFTLVHELAHVWIGASGISGNFSDQKTEKFCNDVASHFLLPKSELGLVGVDLETDFEEAARSITEFARPRHLSSSMVAYRLLRENFITNTTWQSLSSYFVSQWRRMRETQKEKAGDSGPSYYVVRRHRLGHALLEFVSRGISEGTLTPTKAGRILGVKQRSVAPLLSDRAA
jgi:Zn-dependent peptidase ImmA (M78 family)